MFRFKNKNGGEYERLRKILMKLNSIENEISSLRTDINMEMGKIAKKNLKT